MIIKRGATIAVRSESIIEARFSLTSKQNDLLDMVLCEIKDDKQYQYTISVDKYREYYQKDTSNLYRDLDKAAKSFEGKGFSIINKETQRETYYVWFSKIEYIPQKGEVQVNIDLDFKKLLWEVKKKIYYDIRNTLNLNSNYSKRIYYYLKSFEDTGWRVDNIDILQKKLECPPSYKNFADFKRAVLDVAQVELNASNDISFTYKTHKTGRRITNVKFFVEKKEKDNNIPKEIIDTTDKNTQLISSIREFVKESITDGDILELLKLSKDNVDKIKEKYLIMKRQKYVDDIMAWMKSAIRKDYKPKVSKASQGTFNSYNQRKYNFDNLEKNLLGTGSGNIYEDSEEVEEQIALALDK